MTNLKELGLDPERVEGLIVEQAVASLLQTNSYDEDGEELAYPTQLARKVRGEINSRIDAAVEKIGDELLAQRIDDMVANLTFNPTSRYGEPKGEAQTFREYLTARVEAYLTETVNYQGKSKSESGDSYRFEGSHTRVTHLVRERLHHEISNELGKAVKTVNDQIAEGLAETVRLQLKQITEKLKVQVKT